MSLSRSGHRGAGSQPRCGIGRGFADDCSSQAVSQRPAAAIASREPPSLIWRYPRQNASPHRVSVATSGGKMGLSWRNSAGFLRSSGGPGPCGGRRMVVRLLLNREVSR